MGPARPSGTLRRRVLARGRASPNGHALPLGLVDPGPRIGRLGDLEGVRCQPSRRLNADLWGCVSTIPNTHRASAPPARSLPSSRERQKKDCRCTRSASEPPYSRASEWGMSSVRPSRLKASITCSRRCIRGAKFPKEEFLKMIRERKLPILAGPFDTAEEATAASKKRSRNYQPPTLLPGEAP